MVSLGAKAAGVGARSLESEWPERLRRGVSSMLRSCGVPRSEWAAQGLDVHHVVAAGLDGAAPGRRVLARWSVSVHSVMNAAIIPRSFHQGQGLHRHEFLDVVNQRLAAADMFAEGLKMHGGFGAGRLIILQTIQKMGSELVLRSADASAIRLQSALQERLMRPASPGAGARQLRPAGAAKASGRGGRERGYASGEGADRDDASVLGPRRSGFRLAAACS
jgi:hypothetical protein